MAIEKNYTSHDLLLCTYTDSLLELHSNIYPLQYIRMDCTLLQFLQVSLDKWVEVCYVSHQTV